MRVQLVRRRVSAVFLHGVQVGDRRVGDGLPRACGGEVGQAAAGAGVVFICRGAGADDRRSPRLPHWRPEGCQPCLVVAGQRGEQVDALPVRVCLVGGDGVAACPARRLRLVYREVADAQVEHVLALRPAEQVPSRPGGQVIGEDGLGVAGVVGGQPPGHEPPAAGVAGGVVESCHEPGAALVPPGCAPAGLVGVLLLLAPGLPCRLGVGAEWFPQPSGVRVSGVGSVHAEDEVGLVRLRMPGQRGNAAGDGVPCRRWQARKLAEHPAEVRPG